MYQILKKTTMSMSMSMKILVLFGMQSGYVQVYIQRPIYTDHEICTLIKGAINFTYDTNAELILNSYSFDFSTNHYALTAVKHTSTYNIVTIGTLPPQTLPRIIPTNNN